MPLEARKAETNSIYFVNKWEDGQGFIEWKRFFDYIDADNTFTSTRLNTDGLSGRYYFEFNKPDNEAKKVNAAKLEKLKDYIPLEWRIKLMEQKPQVEAIPSLKHLVGQYLAEHGPPAASLDSHLPGETRKFVSSLQKRFTVPDRQDRPVMDIDEDNMEVEAGALTSFEANLLSDIGINAATLSEHKQEILNRIFAHSSPQERAQAENMEFDYKRIAKLISNHFHVTKGNNKIKIVLPGEPIVTISTNSTAPYMLPFKISIAKKKDPKQPNLPKVEHSYVSYSVEIPKMVLKLFGSSINPHSRAILDGSNWWTHKMWVDYLQQ